MARKLTAEFARKVLANVEPDKSFYVFQGPAISNISDLAVVLNQMSNEQFSHHRTGTRNDFFNWIMNVVGDIRLANEVGRSKTCSTMQRKIAQRIHFLEELGEK